MQPHQEPHVRVVPQSRPVAFDYDATKIDEMIPAQLRDGLRRYIERGTRTGTGLRAVLTNDLRGACGFLDEKSYAGLRDIVKFLVNYAPSLCWGSDEHVRDWIEAGGINGHRAKSGGSA